MFFRFFAYPNVEDRADDLDAGPIRRLASRIRVAFLHNIVLRTGAGGAWSVAVSPAWRALDDARWFPDRQQAVAFAAGLRAARGWPIVELPSPRSVRHGTGRVARQLDLFDKPGEAEMSVSRGCAS